MKAVISRSLIFVFLLISATSVFAQKRAAEKTAPQSDLKLRTQMKMEGGMSFETTQYIKGARQRTESNNGMPFITLLQCDLNRYVQLNPQAKTYMINLFGSGGQSTTGAVSAPSTKSDTEEKRGGNVIYRTRYTDTGERQQMFGFTARHIKSSMSKEASPDACDQSKMRMEQDGWYIDFNYGIDCQTASAQMSPNVYGGRTCRDNVRHINEGVARLGYPVKLTMTTYDQNDKPTVMIQEVLELSRETLDPALFEIPADYTEAKNYQELMGVPSQKDDPTEERNGGATSGDTPSAITTAAQESPAAVGPKKPGVIRVGVVLPEAQMGHGLNVNASEPIRNSLMNQLSQSSLEVVALGSNIPGQIEAEVRQKECDYVLHTRVTQKQGGMGGFLKKASPVISNLPVGGVGSSTASVVTTAAVLTAADIASNIKAKDEVSIEYRLMDSSNTQQKATNKLKMKAKSDGDDVLTPMIRQVAGDVIAATSSN
jgi:hypothetical protein